ncbi:unnamed protein product [Clonostachys solani]|uniref:Uncharacterized protein n=1 Tax=Clonostachys solani TaxID=160281 RepID=A0A9N9W794_9HYPO|nr:unnamed protein product [Clonostachys solani]
MSQNSPDSDVQVPDWPHTREWLHQVLENLWGGKEYLPEKLREQEDSIPAVALGALANLYILALTHNMRCESLWEEGGLLRKKWMENGEVLTEQVCSRTQMELEPVFGVDPHQEEKPATCNVTRFQELGGVKRNFMTKLLSKYLAVVEEKFDEVVREVAHLRQTGEEERLRAVLEDKVVVNHILRLPIAGFVRYYQKSEGDCIMGMGCSFINPNNWDV